MKATKCLNVPKVKLEARPAVHQIVVLGLHRHRRCLFGNWLYLVHPLRWVFVPTQVRATLPTGWWSDSQCYPRDAQRLGNPNAFLRTRGRPGGGRCRLRCLEMTPASLPSGLSLWSDQLLQGDELGALDVANGSLRAPRLAARQQTSGLIRSDCAGQWTGTEQTCASHYPISRPHSTARRAARRRFGTPSFMIMRWKRELIELLLTCSSAAMRLLL